MVLKGHQKDDSVLCSCPSYILTYTAPAKRNEGIVVLWVEMQEQVLLALVSAVPDFVFKLTRRCPCLVMHCLLGTGERDRARFCILHWEEWLMPIMMTAKSDPDACAGTLIVRTLRQYPLIYKSRSAGTTRCHVQGG